MIAGTVVVVIDQGEVYNIMCQIKFVSDLRQVGGHFSPGHPVSSNNKTNRHDLTEILLKVALITHTPSNKQTDNDCIIWSLIRVVRTPIVI